MQRSLPRRRSHREEASLKRFRKPPKLGPLAMQQPPISLLSPKNLDETESAILDRIKGGQLLTWIYGSARMLPDSADFMKSVCHVLEEMQKKGLIKGFTMALTGSQPLPIVSRVEIVTPSTA